MSQPPETRKMMQSALEQWSNVQEIAKRYKRVFPEAGDAVEASVRQSATRSLRDLERVMKAESDADHTTDEADLLQVLQGLKEAS